MNVLVFDCHTRMSKDYERLLETGEAFIYVLISRLMARRFGPLMGLFGRFLYDIRA
jgi:hypothetical protein